MLLRLSDFLCINFQSEVSSLLHAKTSMCFLKQNLFLVINISHFPLKTFLEIFTKKVRFECNYPSIFILSVQSCDSKNYFVYSVLYMP